MESTKNAWRVVSDPYAPESSWVAACAETTSIAPSALGQDSAPPQSELRRTCEAIAFSIMVALSGGVLAGQSVHLLYFAQHIIGQAIYSNYLYAPWSDFYYWFNQPNAVMVYMPFFFSFSMGFLSKVKHLGRMSTIANFSALTAYFSLVSLGASGASSAGFNMIDYDSLLLTTGIVGSALAHFFAGSIASNLSSVTKPQRVFYALAAGLVPASLFFSGSFLNSLNGTIIFALVIPIAIGILTSLSTGVTTPKTAALLALAAASPLTVCGLLHAPMAVWFAVNSPIDVGSGVIPSAFRDVVYVMTLPSMALVLPVLGALVGSRLNRKRVDEHFWMPELTSQTASQMTPIASHPPMTVQLAPVATQQAPMTTQMSSPMPTSAPPSAVRIATNAEESCLMQAKQSVELPEQALQ